MNRVKPTKTAKLDVGVWFNTKTQHIHIAAAGEFISTVSFDPRSKRYHPNLYRKLAKCLDEQGLPHPSLEGDGLDMSS